MCAKDARLVGWANGVEYASSASTDSPGVTVLTESLE